MAGELIVELKGFTCLHKGEFDLNAALNVNTSRVDGDGNEREEESIFYNLDDVRSTDSTSGRNTATNYCNVEHLSFIYTLHSEKAVR